MGKALIPRPLSAERHRRPIIAHTGELMALCDELESSLTETATTRRLLEAAASTSG